ncbi:hypothetical protein CEV33_4881 [Brucella grignonensis]|uniref:Uncharacterized protein n=1 Tax=Brucella grignonensis TaxID=94627 RepID=A0A256FT91_9HYPH|nr:hypothetical protein CEV33_4881 [Brucella grignonensis]
MGALGSHFRRDRQQPRSAAVNLDGGPERGVNAFHHRQADCFWIGRLSRSDATATTNGAEGGPEALWQQQWHRFRPVQLVRQHELGQPKGQHFGVRANGRDRRYQVRHREGCCSPGLICRIDHVGARCKAVVPVHSQQRGDFPNEGSGKCPGSARQHSCGKKQLAGWTRIIAWCREQDGVTQRVFVLVAAEHPSRYRGRFKGKAITPAAEPWRIGAHQIIKRFQSDTGRECRVGLAAVVSSWPRPARQSG